MTKTREEIIRLQKSIAEWLKTPHGAAYLAHHPGSWGSALHPDGIDGVEGKNTRMAEGAYARDHAHGKIPDAVAGKPAHPLSDSMNAVPDASAGAHYAVRDASGKVIAAQNADAVTHVASLAKVPSLWYALHAVKEKGGDAAVNQFLQAHASDISSMMNVSDNAAAHRVAQAAAVEAGLVKADIKTRAGAAAAEQAFISGLGQAQRGITAGGDHITQTNITAPAGSGTSTPRDMSLFSYQFSKEFPGVLEKFNNAYRAELFNHKGVAFGKPGEINFDEGNNQFLHVRGSAGLMQNGASYAVMTQQISEGKYGGTVLQEAMLKSGIDEAVRIGTGGQAHDELARSYVPAGVASVKKGLQGH